MLFNSPQFILFFPLVTLAYFLCPHKCRWALLLGASCVFYTAFIPAYLCILLLTVAIDYWAAIVISSSTGRRRHQILVLSICSTCLVLIIFKYFGFIGDNLRALSSFMGFQYPESTINIILPIGLSFHTFQSLSYVIEVYRGKQTAERHFGIYALYVMFYPQLVAGPIERPQNLLKQFREKHGFDYDSFCSGLRLMTWGFFKKVVIADHLAPLVNAVYANPSKYQGAMLLWATLAFTYQIYADFSGYSDIARGAARVMGFRLMTNFNCPYYAESVGEFWRRWHISLSTWFKDYLYIPLGGNHVPPWRWHCNILVTFMVSGLWHGANWTFIAWGALNGFYLIMGQAIRKLRNKTKFAANLSGALASVLRIAFVFMLTCFTWVVFRANSLHDAWYIWSHMFSWETSVWPAGISRYDIMVASAAIGVVECLQICLKQKCFISPRASIPIGLRWGGYAAIVLVIMIFGAYDQQQFVYFQF